MEVNLQRIQKLSKRESKEVLTLQRKIKNAEIRFQKTQNMSDWKMLDNLTFKLEEILHG